MNKVYKHKALASDEYLGHVEVDGKVYESRFGPDKYIGRVELETGKIFEARPGPDKHIGRVDPESGKVYLSRLGPDEYLGHVDDSGRLFLHKRLAPDGYIGKVTEMTSRFHGGAAFLLLVQPAWDEAQVEEKKDLPSAGEVDPGAAPAPA